MSLVRLTTGAALAGGVLLAGCATAPPPPATLSFAGHDCATAPDLARAVSLTPPKPKAMFVVSTPVGLPTAGQPAACLQRAGTSRPYALYALPTEPAGKTLTVGSVLEGARIFSPEVSILDARGQVTRTFAAPDYFYRAEVFSVLFQPKAGEAYVLVAADPTRVAQRYDSIAIGTQTTSTYAAGMAMSWTRGLDQAQSRTFSYDGLVQATVYDDTAKTKTK